MIFRVLFIDRLLRYKYTSFLLFANFSRTFFYFSKLSNYNFVDRRLKIIFVNINKRSFFNNKCRLAKQLSCIYKKYHCLSGVCETYGNKSGSVTGLVREAHPSVSF